MIVPRNFSNEATSTSQFVLQLRNPKLIIPRSKGKFAYSYLPLHDTYVSTMKIIGTPLIPNSIKYRRDIVETRISEIGRINQASTNGPRNQADLAFRA